MILESAYHVFCRKGFLDVTMKDIICECGISRGGIYLYFSSVDEIFQEVVAVRNKSKFAIVREAVNNNEPFFIVFNNFLSLQKKRLLHMENSLLRAMYEYLFSKTEGAAQDFHRAQLDYIKKSVLCMLMLGVSQGVIHDKNIDIIAENILLIIEGLGILALSNILTENIITGQFIIINAIIESIKKN